MLYSVGASAGANRLGRLKQELDASSERLASGSRLTRSSMDPAAVSIASSLMAQQRGYSAGLSNVQQGASTLNIAGGALQSQSDTLQRMRELAVQANNGTNSPDSLAAIQSEMTQLAASLDQVAGSTNFNGQALLDGSTGSMVIQGSGSASDSVDIGAALGDVRSAALGVNALDVTLAGGGTAAINAIDAALGQVNGQMASVGAYSNQLDSMANNLMTANENTSAAFSRLSDVDIASEATMHQVLSVQMQAAALTLKHMQKSSASLLDLIKN